MNCIPPRCWNPHKRESACVDSLYITVDVLQTPGVGQGFLITLVGDQSECFQIESVDNFPNQSYAGEPTVEDWLNLYSASYFAYSLGALGVGIPSTVNGNSITFDLSVLIPVLGRPTVCGIWCLYYNDIIPPNNRTGNGFFEVVELPFCCP